MSFAITNDVIPSAQKVLIYGPEGIGKTTFAACFPKSLFIDTEEGTKKYAVRRLPKPTSWQMIKDEIQYVIQKPDLCDSLIIDTFDWAEQLCVDNICANAQKKGIEDFGYGNGYVYEKEEIARVLHILDEVIALGINVVITCHAQMRKFEQPDELGAYDRWELKLGKKTSSQISPLLKEWADTVIFATYQTYAVAVDDKGKKYKAQGGKRIMYLNHHPCWDAKNRDGLPDGMEFLYGNIAQTILSRNLLTSPEKAATRMYEAKAEIINTAETKPETRLDFVEDAVTVIQTEPTNTAGTINDPALTGSKIPPKLYDLMQASGITETEIRLAVETQGCFPKETPIEKYSEEFINGAIIGDWDNLVDYIRSLREKLPFNN